ncbi:ABC transporter substrate-binding protein [Leptotrichia sp. oral taxon 212]|uniref:ABC transporter substrate-binding protein n=1 Tax=Leptotrichia sp. oral taxon 212 TaxID=712357 RepID=UPI0006A9EE7B|nr:ABC transporter substrate-binding protein [Leptotrichia sp. oral taxon 212]ALA95012.1 nitrate ABC transporter substrate-binding protein [Leptotrichia sp. oral taxon 212]
MKKILRILLFCLLVILAVACEKKDSQGNGGNGEKKSNESPSKKISIVLDWTPNTNHTGLFVAKELGYFKEEGLENVEIVQPPEGSTTALIGAGGAQFGISFQDTLAKSFSSDSPVPVTAVAAIISHNTSGIISVKDKGIDSPKKLEGHKYATWDDEIEKAILKKIITDDGGDFKKVKMIPNTVTDVVTALKTDIDAVWVYYAWDGIATELAGLQTNFLNFADYGKELDYYSPVIIANNDYLKKNPEEAKKVLKAIKKGYEYSIKNPKEAAKILVKNAPELKLELVTASQEWLASKYTSYATEWGVIDQKRWDLFYEWLFKNGLIKKEIPKGYGFSNDYLEIRKYIQ